MVPVRYHLGTSILSQRSTLLPIQLYRTVTQQQQQQPVLLFHVKSFHAMCITIYKYFQAVWRIRSGVAAL